MITCINMLLQAQNTYNANGNAGPGTQNIINIGGALNCTSIGSGAYNINPASGPLWSSLHNTFYGGQAGNGILGGGSNNFGRNTFVGALSGTVCTNPANNTFIGFRAGANSVTATPFGQVFVGSYAGDNSVGAADCYMGFGAGFFANNGTPFTETRNCYFGREAGALLNGANNCVFGAQWGSGVTNFEGNTAATRISNDNCFFGSQSGHNINGGTQNVFMGINSGAVNTTGSRNIFLGRSSASSNTIGNSNIFIGDASGTNNATGNYNIALGTSTILGTASTNTISIGSFANIIQNNSMLLGATQFTSSGGGYVPNVTFDYMRVGINTATPTHQLHIANSTGATDVNSGAATNYARVRFDRLPLTTDNLEFVVTGTNGVLYRRTVNLAPFVGCATGNFVPKQDPVNPTQQICSQIFDDATSVAIGWAAPGGPPVGFANYSGVTTNITPGSIVPPATGIARLVVNGVTMTHGVSYTSDKRFKKDIKPITSALEKIKQLNGVSYNWRKDEFKDKNFDDLNQIGFIAQEVEKVIPQAVIKDGEGYYAMNYTMLIPVLTEAMKEQQKMIEQQQKEIDELKAIVKGTAPKSILENPVKTIQLFQNVPNPFSKETDIKFFLPETVKQANLTIYDMQGKQLRKIDINERNEASIKINAKELPAGMYMYSLIADGKEMDTKRMILTDY